MVPITDPCKEASVKQQKMLGWNKDSYSLTNTAGVNIRVCEKYYFNFLIIHLFIYLCTSFIYSL